VKSYKLSAIIFIGIVLLIPILSILQPFQTYSPQENRTLAIFPVLSYDDYMNRNFMTGFEDFISDHFYARNMWVDSKSMLEYIRGKRDNQGVYIGYDKQLFQIVDPIDKSKEDTAVSSINIFAKRFNKPIFYMTVPSASQIETDNLPSFANPWDQELFAKQFTAKLRVTPIDIFTTLKNHKNEYIYYTTDHHWTTLGAYYAYQKAGEALGYKPFGLSSYNVEKASTDFHGSMVLQSGFIWVKPDIVEYFINKENKGIKSLTISDTKKTFDSPYMEDELKKNDKYLSFFGGNYGLLKIKGSSDTGRLLVFKDSYANSFLPFLAANFSEIDVIDLRGINDDIAKYVDLSSYDKALFLVNNSNVSLDGFRKLSWVD
jgi:hypothetical protein